MKKSKFDPRDLGFEGHEKSITWIRVLSRKPFVCITIAKLGDEVWYLDKDSKDRNRLLWGCGIFKSQPMAVPEGWFTSDPGQYIFDL